MGVQPHGYLHNKYLNYIFGTGVFQSCTEVTGGLGKFGGRIELVVYRVQWMGSLPAGNSPAG